LDQPASADLERSLVSGTAAVITWLHATGLQNALDSRALPAIVYAATAFAAATLAFLLLGFAQIAARPRHRATVAILFTVATIASIVRSTVAARRQATGRGQHHSAILDRS
jgi:hypothetical protein